MIIEFDQRELRNLEHDLTGAPGRVQRGSTQVLRRGAAIVDVAMQADAKGHSSNYFGRASKHGPLPLEKHVSHEMLNPFTAEIGIEYEGAGKLAHILAFGSVNNSPVFDKNAGLNRSEPEILRMFAEMGEESVLGGHK